MDRHNRGGPLGLLAQFAFGNSVVMPPPVLSVGTFNIVIAATSSSTPTQILRAPVRHPSMRDPLSGPGAGRARDFPDIHSSSPAAAGRQEGFAVPPIHTGVVALRHVGPWVA